MTDAARIYATEVFSAIQGEGAKIGERQVFLRLAGCNIRCAYCDQPESLDRRAGPCRVEQTPGMRDWSRATSPVPVSEIAEAIDRLCSTLVHHSVSVTGGEPLFQSGRLVGLLPLLTARGHRIYLETNGMLVPGLEKVADQVHFVSMDLKLSSVDGEHVDPSVQRRFLRTSLSAGHDLWCKIVLGANTRDDELARAVEMVNEESPSTEIFLQPVTPFAGVHESPTARQVLRYQELALSIHGHVRVVPQTHKMIGQL